MSRLLYLLPFILTAAAILWIVLDLGTSSAWQDSAHHSLSGFASNCSVLPDNAGLADCH